MSKRSLGLVALCILQLVGGIGLVILGGVVLFSSDVVANVVPVGGVMVLLLGAFMFILGFALFARGFIILAFHLIPA